MNDYMLSDLDEAMRVEIHPGLDAWMQGDRFGTIWRIGRTSVHVKMDRSRRLLKLDPKFIHDVVMTAAEYNRDQARRREAATRVMDDLSPGMKFDGHRWTFHGPNS